MKKKKLTPIKTIVTSAAVIICILTAKVHFTNTTKPPEIINNTDITNNTDLINSAEFETKSSAETENLTNLDTLRQKYYTVPAATAMTPDLFNVTEFENAYLKLSNIGSEPKILVFHTHSMERFSDSGSDISEGVVGAGERLCQLLESRYHIKCLHITQSFDVVDGKTQILGAYERMEPYIRQVLAENPSIEMVIDMHRDGVPDTTHLVTDINGKQTAQIMFFNGLCLLNENGTLSQPEGLTNPYLKTNLALSYNLKINADKMYPGFARKIYLNAYRYSLHMKPLSTLIEVGAQTNTKEEIYNAIDLLADVIAETIA